MINHKLVEKDAFSGTKMDDVYRLLHTCSYEFYSRNHVL